MRRALIFTALILCACSLLYGNGLKERSYKYFLKETAIYLSERIQNGTKVAIIPIGSRQGISEYIISEFMQSLLEINTLVIVIKKTNHFHLKCRIYSKYHI